MDVEEDPFGRLAFPGYSLLLHLNVLAHQISSASRPPILASDKPDRARIGPQLLPQDDSSSVNNVAWKMNDLLLNP